MAPWGPSLPRDVLGGFPYPSSQLWMFPRPSVRLWGLSKSLVNGDTLTSSIESPYLPARLPRSPTSTLFTKSPWASARLQRLPEAPHSFKTSVEVSSSFEPCLGDLLSFSSVIESPYSAHIQSLPDINLVCRGFLAFSSSTNAPWSTTLLQRLLKATQSFRTSLGVYLSLSSPLRVPSSFRSSIGIIWLFKSSMGFPDVQLVYRVSLSSTSSTKAPWSPSRLQRLFHLSNHVWRISCPSARL